MNNSWSAADVAANAGGKIVIRGACRARLQARREDRLQQGRRGRTAQALGDVSGMHGGCEGLMEALMVARQPCQRADLGDDHRPGQDREHQQQQQDRQLKPARRSDGSAKEVGKGRVSHGQSLSRGR